MSLRRYEVEDDAKLILINTPILNQSLKEGEAIYITVPIGIVAVENKIITITLTDNPIIDKIVDNKIRNFNPSDQSMFVLHLLEQNVYGVAGSNSWTRPAFSHNRGPSRTSRLVACRAAPRALEI